MANFGIGTVIFVTLFLNSINGQNFKMLQSPRCKMPAAATRKIEKVIESCQEEIKFDILKEALESIKQITAQNVAKVNAGLRTKRDLFTEEEQKIAGCLLQCVYKKVNAVDKNGLPTVEGLVNLYADGILERGYFLATAHAVQQCLYIEYQNQLLTVLGDIKEQSCHLAYKVFDCISDQLASYCSGT